MGKINILGTEYAVSYVDSISREELRVGEINYIEQEILILNGLGKDLQRSTLLHEIIHGVLNQLGFEEAEDEHLIQSLASGLYQVLKENKLKF